MKQGLIALLAAASLTGLPVMAADGVEPGTAGGTGSSGGSAADEDAGQLPGRMRDDVQEMQRLMDRAQRTRDPEERRELTRQHHETLRQTLASIRNMRWQADCPTDGNNACLAEHQRMLEQRLDLMQQVLEQLIQQQSILIERTRR